MIKVERDSYSVYVGNDGKIIGRYSPSAWFLERRIRWAIKRDLHLVGMLARIQEDFNP